MASILLIEDGPGIGRQLPGLLAADGHRVLRCGGGPTPLAACPLLRQGRCALAEAAELLVFACSLDLPLRGRAYRGRHLLRAYRTHPDYGRLPLVLEAIAPPQDLEGTGPTELVDTFTDPAAVLAAVHRLLSSRPAPTPAVEHHGGVRSHRGGQLIADSTSQPISAAVPETTGGRCRHGAGLGHPLAARRLTTPRHAVAGGEVVVALRAVDLELTHTNLLQEPESGLSVPCKPAHSGACDVKERSVLGLRLADLVERDDFTRWERQPFGSVTP